MVSQSYMLLPESYILVSESLQFWLLNRSFWFLNRVFLVSAAGDDHNDAPPMGLQWARIPVISRLNP